MENDELESKREYDNDGRGLQSQVRKDVPIKADVPAIGVSDAH